VLDVNYFDSMQIALASPERIRQWSRGEVKKPETINYRTLRPEREGLFCEKIFGPQRDWECHCGKYKRVRYKGIVCDRCGVEVTRSKVRRDRMGHIELAAPVSHIWYFKGIPSRMGLILDISPRALEKVLYFASYIVVDPGGTPLMEKQLLSENEYREYREKYGSQFKAGMGAEAVKKLLEALDLEKLAADLRTELKTVSGQRRVRAIRRLDVVEAFRKSGNQPEWMVMDVVPVIPPDLRPMVQLDGGRFATSDLNDLYRRVINRNNRLKRLLDLGAPDIIVRNEKRMLQEAVDALVDNGRRGRPVTGPGNRPLKSLSDMLKGKQGRFRQNLLGKRVDYSGRSVIVVGPSLKLHQCGLPKEMALELFKPFVMKKLVNEGYAHNIKSAKRMVERVKPEVWEVLEDVIKEHPVLLNRAPTLHRLGIQAFEPILVEGRAINIHPLVCTAYNADFDGDQMAVHVPLSAEAQAEARILMLAAHNILNPKDGAPVITPSKDMLLGSYYLTIAKPDAPPAHYYSHPHEALMAYQDDAVELHDWVEIRFPFPPAHLEPGSEAYLEHKENWGSVAGQRVKTTVGRMIFNEILHPSLRYMNVTVEKKQMGKIIDMAYRKLGTVKTAELTDNIKGLGFIYATKSGSTIAIADIHVPPQKAEILGEAEKRVEEVERNYKRGLITNDERYQRVIQIWSEAKEAVTKTLIHSMEDFNPVNMMMKSGARGNISQITQLAGMRGLMADPSGKIVELPVKANFREGLSVLEYFLSTHGTRKGLADTALRTADSGYLTRRLVDVAQDVIVREDDCGTTAGITWAEVKEGENLIESITPHIVGRALLYDVKHPVTGAVMLHANEIVEEEVADQIKAAGITEVTIRSVLTCRARFGACRLCYGRNLASGRIVDVGEAVGIIAAQSIGEPGTQLTMRTFHTGGVAGDDITQGLPRVEELFEARKPKGQAVIAELDGQVSTSDNKGKKEITITAEDGEATTYSIPYGARVKVRDGSTVEAGMELTEGSVNPHDLLRVKGLRGVQMYLLREVQKVYNLQGVDINDKHIEVMVRQMLRKVKVEDPGDTALLPGQFTDIFDFEDENERVIMDGGIPAVARPMLLGITKASLATDSFLSAASFQETTRVLTDAAIKGKRDPLLGLKENVIIGKLVPAGTGMNRYRGIRVLTEDEVLAEQAEGADD
jgi:DNA-directed RNA polymerase subunit beta'